MILPCIVISIYSKIEKLSYKNNYYGDIIKFMNRFLKLFTPSDEKLSKLSFNDLQQLPVAILGNIIFLFGFSTTFVAEMLRGTYLTASGSGVAVIIFITALILIKLNKIQTGLMFDTFGILVAIISMVFFLHGNDNIFEIYRSVCFIIVMAIFNQLFAISKRQLGIFFGVSSAIWIAAIIFLFPQFFTIDFKETIAAICIGSIAFLGSNFAILLLNKQKDKINEKAIEEQKSTEKSLATIRNVLNQTSENIEIGNELSNQVSSLADSFDGIKNLYSFLNQESKNLAEKASNINSSSEQVKNHVKEMQQNVLTQTKSLGMTSKAISDISESIDNISVIADKRRSSMTEMEQAVHMQQEKISELVNEVKKVSDSTASILSFVTTVNDVASRTGLLAMNASIEAAHAGTLGKGFSVIAQEIRKLSDETNRNAAGIEDEISHIVELVSQASVAAQNCINYTNTSNESLNSTIQGIEEILSAVKEMSAGVNAVLETLTNIVNDSHTSNELVEKSVAEINNQGTEITMITEFAENLESKVYSLNEKIVNAEQALVLVKDIAEQNSTSVQKLTETIKA